MTRRRVSAAIAPSESHVLDHSGYWQVHRIREQQRGLGAVLNPQTAGPRTVSRCRRRRQSWNNLGFTVEELEYAPILERFDVLLKSLRPLGVQFVFLILEPRDQVAGTWIGRFALQVNGSANVVIVTVV